MFQNVNHSEARYTLDTLFQTSFPSKKSPPLGQSRTTHILNPLEAVFSTLAGANSNR